MPEYPKNLMGTAYEKYYEDDKEYQVPDNITNFLVSFYLHASFSDLDEWDKEADLNALEDIDFKGWLYNESDGTFWFSAIINDIMIERVLNKDNYFVGGKIVKLVAQEPKKPEIIIPVTVTTERFSDLDY